MKRSQNTTWFLLLVLVVIVAFIGCDSNKGTTTSTPSASSTVTVSTSPSSIENGSTSVVEATVVSSSTGVPNQVVTFTVSPSNAGYFTPSVDTTDANGIAASVFTAITTGSATISCSVNGGSASGTAGMTVSDAPQAGSGNITINPSQSLLLANGADTSHLTISVRDANGQLAPDNTVVKFVAGEKFDDIDGNGYWTNGIDTIVYDANMNNSWDAIGYIKSTDSTVNGAVSVDFISGNEASTVYIKATVNSNGIVGNAELQMQLTPNAAINSIYLSSDSLNLAVKQTGGIETSTLHATCFDEFGNTVPEGLTIEFIITDGPGGGEHLGNTGAGPYVAVTNSQGVATAPISSGTVSGTIRIRATAPNAILSNATQVMVSAGPPAYIVIGAEDCNVPFWYTVAEENPIVAVVSDIYLNPVTDSTVVYFSTDEGTMKSHEARTGDLEGTVSTKWISGTNVPTADGVVLIIAETSGGTVADTSYFYNSSYATTITTSGMPASMVADGVEKATVVVNGSDVNGNPVDGGVEFNAEANYVSVGGSTFEDGCGVASARIKITSTTLKVDNSTPGGNDDGIGAVDNIQFWSGTAFTTVPLTLTTGTAYSGNSSITAVSSVAANEVVDISALIADRWGNPLGDHTLNMTASGGVVAGATQETDGYGEANGFTWTAPVTLGDYTITITDTDPRGGIILSAKITVE